MSTAKTTVLGLGGSGKSTVISSILTYGHVSSSTESVWEVDTKYYTASVELCDVSANEEKEATSHLEGSEAVVLVVDLAGATDPISAVTALTSTFSDAWDVCGTRLCVGTKLDLLEDRSMLQKLVEWSLDAGFEFVECVATDPDATRDDRDKTGIARVVQALETTMWSNMKRKAPPSLPTRKPPPGGEAPTVSSSSSTSTAPATTTTTSDPVASAPTSTPSTTATATTTTTAPAGAGAGSGASPTDTTTDTTTDPAQPSGVAAEEDMTSDKALESLMPPAPADLVDDAVSSAELKDVEALDRLMQRMAFTRDTAGSQTDEMRRANAASLAMQLAALMGFDDDEGTDSEEEEEEEGEHDDDVPQEGKSS